MSKFAVICSLALFATAASGLPARSQQLAYCKADAARLCPGVRPGGGRLLSCLKAQENDLTVGCAKELKAMKARMGK